MRPLKGLKKTNDLGSNSKPSRFFPRILEIILKRGTEEILILSGSGPLSGVGFNGAL